MKTITILLSCERVLFHLDYTCFFKKKKTMKKPLVFQTVISSQTLSDGDPQKKNYFTRGREARTTQMEGTHNFIAEPERWNWRDYYRSVEGILWEVY